MNAGDSARSTWHARRRHHGEGSVDMGFPVGWNRALLVELEEVEKLPAFIRIMGGFKC